MIQIRNFINGQWQEETGGKTVPLYNPSTGETIGSVPVSNMETCEAAIATAASYCIPAAAGLVFFFRNRQGSLQNVAPRPHRQAHDLYS